MTTTEDRLHTLAQRRQRDRLPAGSARILAAGLSIASVLGLASAIRAVSLTSAPTAPSAELDVAVIPVTLAHSSAPSELPGSPIVERTVPIVTMVVDPAPAVVAPRRVTLDTPVAPVSEPSATTSGSK